MIIEQPASKLTPLQLCFELYVNHFTVCNDCSPRNERYCDTGFALFVDYQAAFVLSFDDVKDRRHWIKAIVIMSPKFADAIKVKVLQEFEKSKSQ